MSGEASNQERLSGVLLHVTSLPSYGGVGDFGPAAYAFVDFLAASKQRLWQVLPLSPTGYGSSPYSALSAYAGNPLLISLERLVEEGWIGRERIEGLPGHDGPVDFGAVYRPKPPLLEEAAGNFLDHADDAMRTGFQHFCDENAYWLTDYAMFSVLRQRHGYVRWNEGPVGVAQRKHDALAKVLTEHARALEIEQVIQYFFTEQWTALRAYCRERGIRVMGDVAIFVNYDGGVVGTHQALFALDGRGLP